MRKNREVSSKNIENLLGELEKIKTIFDSQAKSARLRTLKKIADSEIADVYLLETYHDLLCFIRAYPDNRQVLDLVEKELEGFSLRVDLYKKTSRDRKAKRLFDTGIVNTAVAHTFSYELTASLSEWFKDKVEIDWDTYWQEESDKIGAILPVLVAWQENDTLDNDLTIDTADWLKIARAKSDGTGLSILLKLLKTSGLSRSLQRYLFENAEVLVKWDLQDCPASRTLKRIKCGNIFYQRAPLLGRTKDLRNELGKPASPLERLPRREGEKYCRHIKEILGVRCRELYPLMHSNPSEIYISEPGRGVRLVILGNIMDIRLPLESNLGAILIRNGMPIGYGIGCMLFDRVEIAINVFPSYRAGESSFIIEQFFRLFYHHFGARLYLVRSYQVGDDNQEALESGSFWFYYKLGFRSVSKRTRGLADEEYEKIKADRSYRCPLNILKRLAKSDVFFHVDPQMMSEYRELPLKNLGYIVTRYIADKFDGDRRIAANKSMANIARILDIKNLRAWTNDEITGFERLAPLIACIPDLSIWTAKEKRALIGVIESKGATCERDFVRLSNKHWRFKDSIHKMAFAWKM